MKSVNLTNEDHSVLSNVGTNVRNARIKNRFTRKELAKKSGVSERYLAQLETGRGNASIVTLKNVCDALQLTLPDLLTEQNEYYSELSEIQNFLRRLSRGKLLKVQKLLTQNFKQNTQQTRVALIGLRGAGKTTIGKALAKKLGIEFIEVDKEIERLAGLTLSEIFLLYGQEGYRRFERTCLIELLNKKGSECIIETGGGVVSDKTSYDLILSSCFTVWVKADPKDHMARVIAQGDTRIISSTKRAMEDLKKILEHRTPLYELADRSINTSEKNLTDCLCELSNTIRTDNGAIKI